jgi:hypothetical protein
MTEEALSVGGAWARREEKGDGERCGGGRQSRRGAHPGSKGGRAMTAKRQWRRSSVEVALKLRKERRRAGMGAGKIGRDLLPFIGAGGRRRRRLLKMKRGKRLKAELRHRGFNGRPLRVLHGVRKRERRRDGHGAAARGRGGARSAQQRRKGGKGKGGTWPDGR